MAIEPMSLENAQSTRRLRKARQIEEQEALEHRIEVLTSLRQARENGTFGDDVFQLAQALILCGLPYEPTTETKLVRKARLADGTQVIVTFSAALDAPLPFGSDRTLLHFILDRAVKTGSRFVSWNTAAEFLKAMGMTVCGKNTKDLKKRFERIRGLTIGVVRFNKRGSDKSRLMPVLRRTNLPTSIEVKAEQSGAQLLPLGGGIIYGVELDEDFHNDLMAYHVPAPSCILKATRKQSQMQDLMLFLHYRSYCANGPSLIPWRLLKDQLWHADHTERRIRFRFAEAIKALKVMWPELQAEARQEGLWIDKPLNGVYLIPTANTTRKLSNKADAQYDSNMADTEEQNANN